MASPAPVNTGLIGKIKKIPPVSGFVRAHNLGRQVVASRTYLLKNVGMTVAGFVVSAVTGIVGLQMGAVGALLLAATPGIAPGIPGLAAVTLLGGIACASAGTWVCSFSSGLLLQSADNVGSGFVNTGKAIGKAADKGVKSLSAPKIKMLPAPAPSEVKADPAAERFNTRATKKKSPPAPRPARVEAVENKAAFK